MARAEENQFLVELQDALSEASDSGMLPLERMRTFEEAGLMTRNVGLVLTLEDGRKFQLTIVDAS